MQFLKRFGSAVFPQSTPQIVRDVRADSLTFLDAQALTDLYVATQQCERGRREGIIIEAGCAAGGSAIVIAAAKERSRKLVVLDAFALIPPPSSEDGADVHERFAFIKSGAATGIGDRIYYGYEADLRGAVEASFSRHGFGIGENNVTLTKGLFQDTLIVSEPVALAHLDGDWYESTMVCLSRIIPRLVSGGVLIIDDYFAWSGCKKAVDEFFLDKKTDFSFVRKSRLHILRN